jgi:hypothetical protein
VKTYIVYKNGYEVGTVKANGQNNAEKKAYRKYADSLSDNIIVMYTEV